MIPDDCEFGDHFYSPGSATCSACGHVNHVYLGYLSGLSRRAKKAGRTRDEQEAWELARTEEQEGRSDGTL